MALGHQECSLVWFASNYRCQLKPHLDGLVPESIMEIIIALLQITFECLQLLTDNPDSN